MACFLPQEEMLDRAGLERLQRRKLAEMLGEILSANPFYREKFRSVSFEPTRDPLNVLPLTTREELQRDQRNHPPYGTNLTYPQDRYVRLHQTSGSSAPSSSSELPQATVGPDSADAGLAPLRWLDTAESWKWFRHCWKIIYTAARVKPSDRLFFPFSFGPFVGFWAAFETALEQGNFCLPAGGMTTLARLNHLLENQATVVCCTPTYALRMAEVAAELKIDLAASPVWALIVAGEPGGCIPATRNRIEKAWGARIFDHTGMTEMGSCSFECTEAPGGVHVIESEFIAEVIDPVAGHSVAEGEQGELVLTNLGRLGSPLIRYRTGDLVRMIRTRCACGRWFARLDGGILGRADDMVVIRGNNLFPSTVEGLLRGFEEVADFRMEVDQRGALPELRIWVEARPLVDAGRLGERIQQVFQDRFHFRPVVMEAAAGSLPKFEMKSRRVTILR